MSEQEFRELEKRSRTALKADMNHETYRAGVWAADEIERLKKPKAEHKTGDADDVHDE